MSFPIGQVESLPSYGGSLQHWVDRVRGTDFDCPYCDETFVIGCGRSQIYAHIRFPESMGEQMKAAMQDLLGKTRNIKGVSEETAASALRDAEGNRASAFFTCPGCKYQFGHHREEMFGPYGE